METHNCRLYLSVPARRAQGKECKKKNDWKEKKRKKTKNSARPPKNTASELRPRSKGLGPKNMHHISEVRCKGGTKVARRAASTYLKSITIMEQHATPPNPRKTHTKEWRAGY